MSGTPFRPPSSIWEVLGRELERRIDDAVVEPPPPPLPQGVDDDEDVAAPASPVAVLNESVFGYPSDDSNDNAVDDYVPVPGSSVLL